MKKNMMLVIGLLVLASMILAACQPQTLVETKIVEVEKTVEVVTTVEVEVEGEAFTTPHPILGDLRVRQAIAYCTNKLDLVKSVYPLVDEEAQKSLIMNTFIPSSQWAYAGDENITIYEFNPEMGMALLDEAGWVDDGSGTRYNEAGDSLSLKFTTTTATFRQTWAAVFEKQMADCGIQVIRFHVPASWWFGDTTGLARRDFELGAFAWVGQADPGGATLYACDMIPSPANGWAGQNYMGWCNETASVAMKNATNNLLQDERAKYYTVAQQEFTKDVPSIPLFNRTESYAVNSALVGFEPKPGESYYTYNVEQWELPGKDTIVIGFTQEPASLFTLVEDAFVANIAAALVSDFSSISPNFTFEGKLQKGLATIESGAAANNDVEVKDGDMVWSAAGEPTALAAGVSVFNAAGEEVEFAGSPVTMKQLVVKYEFLEGLTWSDGEPLKQADFELAWAMRCDRSNGATSFIICDMIQDVQFDGLTYTVTYLPGIQDPTYFLAPIGFYPAHRVLSDGRVLADVPPAEWATLPEIAENPIGVGPYVLKEWVKGEKMVFEANPFYYGEVKTPNLVISFITPENAEAQLLGGSVDVLGSETVAGVSQTLADADAAGTIRVIVEPGATWEHIDISLFVK